MRMRRMSRGWEPVMKSGKRGLGRSGWKQRPTVSSTLHLPLWLQPSSTDGVGKSDSQLACLRGQDDRELGPTPATQAHPPSRASSSHGPRGLIPWPSCGSGAWGSPSLGQEETPSVDT